MMHGRFSLVSTAQCCSTRPASFPAMALHPVADQPRSARAAQLHMQACVRCSVHTLPCCPPPELGCAAGDDSEEGLWVPSRASPGRGGLCRGRGPGRRAASPGGATPPGSPHPHGRQPPTVRSGRMALQRKPVQGACALASRRTAVRGSDRGRVGSCSACVRLVAASCQAAQATLMHKHSQAYDAGCHPFS